MSARMRMTIGKAVAIMLWLLAVPVGAGLLVSERGGVRVVLVDASTDAAKNLELLRTTLVRRFAVAPQALVALEGNKATSERIEQMLSEAAMTANQRDTLFLFLDLPLNKEGRDRILASAGFKPSEPWTGLPVSTAIKIANGARAQMVWLVYPSCATEKDSAFDFSGGPSSIALIAYCAPEADASAVATALASALDAAASRAVVTFSPEQNQEATAATSDQVGLFLETHLTGLPRPEGLPPLVRISGYASLPIGVTPGDSVVPSALVKEMSSLQPNEDVSETFARWLSAYRDGRVDSDSLERDLVAIAIAPVRRDNTAVLAVQSLPELGPATAARALARVFDTSVNPAVRREAVLQMPARDQTAVVDRALRDSNASVRAAALERALLREEVERVDVAAGLAVSDPDAHVRALALRAFVAMGPSEKAFQLVLRILDASAASEVRREALIALGKLPPQRETVPRLLKHLSQDPEAGVRESAAYALSSLDPTTVAHNARDASQVVDAALGRGPDSVDVAVLRAIGKTQLSNLLPRVNASLADESRSSAVRRAAADALGALRDPRAIEALAAAACAGGDGVACTPPHEVQVAAIAALGTIPDSRAVGIAWRALDRKDPYIAAAARSALQSARTSSPEVVEALNPKAPVDRRRLAAQILASAREGPAELIGLLGDPDPGVRRFAIIGAGHDPANVERLHRAMKEDPDPTVSAAAAEALARIGNPSAMRALVRESTNADPDIAAKAVIELPQQRQSEIDLRGFVRSVENSTSLAVRVEATQTLGQYVDEGSRIERVEARAALKQMATSDSNPAVREAAVQQLRDNKRE